MDWISVNLLSLLSLLLHATGEPLPPLLTAGNFLVRVSRGPESDQDPSGESVLSQMRVPSYQHKIIEGGRLSNFLHQPHSSHLNFLRGGAGELSLYPVTSVHHRQSGGHPAQELSRDEGFLNEAGLQLDIGQGPSGQESSTYTPYIGSRALSDVAGFFKQLQDSVRALEGAEEDPNFELLDQPSRRVDPTGAEASRDLLAYMGRDPQYKMANGRNPHWLFTNMGLGKRKRSSERR